MSDALLIGEYQLANLQRNGVRFLFLDLRSKDKRRNEGVGHSLLTGATEVPSAYSTPTTEDGQSFVASLQLPSNHPVVLMCEDGTLSQRLAGELEKQGFINVYVLMGGSRSLDLGSV